jgi:hypothetical protein
LINLRYHIVSITAVFLALGIGLTLGTSFLDRVTVDTLKQQLDDVEARVRATDAQNAELSDQLARLQDRDEQLLGGAGRVVEGRLADVPVLLVATEGTDEALVEQTLATLVASGADVAGAWWLTERWALDDDDEVEDMAEVLGITSTDAERLLRAGTARLAQLLHGSGEPVSEPGRDPTDPDDASAPEDLGDPPPFDEEEALAEGDTVAATVPTEPELVAALAAAGFIDYQALATASDPRVLLPPAGTRFLLVSNVAPATGPGRAVEALLGGLPRDVVLPVLAAQGDTDLLGDGGEPAQEDDRRTTFVGPLRASEDLRDRLSTLDALDSGGGLLAAVVALDDLGSGIVGHYGVAPGAGGLVPASLSP